MKIRTGKRYLVAVVIELSATDVTKSDPAERADDDNSAGEHSRKSWGFARIDPLRTGEHSAIGDVTCSVMRLVFNSCKCYAINWGLPSRRQKLECSVSIAPF